MAAAIPLRIPMWPIQPKQLIAMLKGAKRNTHAHPNTHPNQAQAKYPCAWVYCTELKLHDYRISTNPEVTLITLKSK
jgi:hypothetical protein